MITQAKIKNLVNDFNAITAAMNSYQDRYRAIPGDDRNATTRWASASLLAVGTLNGDGQIAGTYNNALTAATTAAQESNLFWWHLRLSGFVAGPTSGVSAGIQPNNAVNGIMGVQTGDGTATTLSFGALIICSSNLPDKVAIAVDSQMDDGAPNTGQVRGQSQTAPYPDFSGAATGYQETGTNKYLLCKTL